MKAQDDGTAFANAIELFIGKIETLPDFVIDHAAEIALRSVRIGSAITGSPGQPVDTGALRDSFVIERVDRWTRQIMSPLIYAGMIEDGIGAHGPLILRSKVGGFHSIKLTAAGWPNIVHLVVADWRAAA